MFGFDIFAIVFVALVILTLFAGVKTVSQGYNWTVERFGRYMRTLSPGLNIIVPFIDRIGRGFVDGCITYQHAAKGTFRVAGQGSIPCFFYRGALGNSARVGMFDNSKYRWPIIFCCIKFCD